MEDTDNNLLFTERIFLQKSSNFLRNILFPIRSTSPLTITYSLTHRSLKNTFSPQIILPPRLVVLKIIFVRLIHLQTNKYIFLLTPSSCSPPNFSSISVPSVSFLYSQPLLNGTVSRHLRYPVCSSFECMGIPPGSRSATRRIPKLRFIPLSIVNIPDAGCKHGEGTFSSFFLPILSSPLFPRL